jgi:amino acid adenylation domain-containing protein
VRDRTLIDIFDAHRGAPQRTALIGAGGTFSYDDLAGASEELARRLVQQGAGRESRVGIAIDTSTEAVIAILAVLRAGAAYVPLDPTHPQERLRFLVGDAGCELVLGRRESDLSWLPNDVEAVLVDRAAPGPAVREAAAEAGTNAVAPSLAPPVPDDEAYVMYTSGSTGRPKGCSLSHRNVTSFVESALPRFDVGATDRWTMLHSISFDFSVWEMWATFATGATLVAIERLEGLDPRQLLDVCREHEVTVFCVVPSVLSTLLQSGALAGSLRYVVLGGEPFRPDDVARAMAAGRGVTRFINMYGPTEVTVAATAKELTADDLVDAARDSVIGTEFAPARVLLVSEDGHEVPDGVDGEILIAGPGLSRGYVGLPELTDERFVTIDGTRMYRSGDLGRRLPNGDLSYRGRVDDQVKVRGFRIELGEVEEVLRAHGEVNDACAAVVAEPGGNRRLEAAVVLRDAVPIEDVRAFVAERIPRHMVPSRLVVMSEIPRFVSGKADRSAVVTALAGSGPDSTSPALAECVPGGRPAGVEHVIRAAWNEVLGHDDFGGADEFFAVGGDSLSAVKVHRLIEAEIGAVALPLRDLFKHPTIDDLAAQLRVRMEGEGAHVV